MKDYDSVLRYVYSQLKKVLNKYLYTTHEHTFAIIIRWKHPSIKIMNLAPSKRNDNKGHIS